MTNFPTFQGIPKVSEREGTLLLHVPDGPVALPSAPIQLLEGEFLPKDEFHITVIGRKPGARLQHAGVAMDTVRQVARQVTWTVHPREAFWLIEASPKPGYAEERRSIIQLVEVPELGAFLDALAENCDTPFPAPPVHMTWFTQNWPNGIGLDTEDKFRKRRVRRLSDSEVARLRDDCTHNASR